MGLSGAGKTTLAEKIITELKQSGTVTWFNADQVRKEYNDWDFSIEGRLKQAKRLRSLANKSSSDFVVVDFIAPLPEQRETFDADFTVWVDTTESSRYRDTDSLFQPPSEYNYRVNDYSDNHVNNVLQLITNQPSMFNVLSGIQILEKRFLVSKYSGIDSPTQCKNQSHFNNYSKNITYEYNSRGFRDREWPAKNLDDIVWCFGDSFTAGIGQPFDETWVNVLAQNVECVNISLDGASVNWITRQVLQVLQEVKPKNIIIQWTFLHRRELDDSDLTDCERRILCDKTQISDDITNFFNCLTEIAKYQGNTTIIHSWIPGAISDVPNSCEVIVKLLENQYNLVLENVVTDNSQLDFARDGFHYDIDTSKKYAKHYLNLLSR